MVVSNGFHLHHLPSSVVLISIGIMVEVVAVVLIEAILVAAGVVVIEVIFYFNSVINLFLSQCVSFLFFTI